MDSIYLLSYMQNKLERMSWKSIETGSLVIMIFIRNAPALSSFSLSRSTVKSNVTKCATFLYPFAFLEGKYHVFPRDRLTNVFFFHSEFIL